MKSTMVQTSADQFENALKLDANFAPNLVLIFSSTEILKTSGIQKNIVSHFPTAVVMGCSTAGEIGDSNVSNDQISMIAMQFDRSEVRPYAVAIADMADSRAAGERLGKNFSFDKLAGVFVLLPGLNVNGSQFLQGLRATLPAGITITGGMAGDGLRFAETSTFLNNQAGVNQAVAVGFYGDKITVRSGSRGGWKPFGPMRRVTRAEGSILYSLDNRPALDLYKEYLGDKAADLPSSGLLYPFAIIDPDKTEQTGLIRTILNIDEENKTLILAGDMETGQLVSLMHGNTDELVEGAADAIKVAKGGGSIHSDDVVICVSCVGRKILMGLDTEEEVETVRDASCGASVVGFYSYGEISPYAGTQVAELHNQTMTVTIISEQSDHV